MPPRNRPSKYVRPTAPPTSISCYRPSVSPAATDSNFPTGLEIADKTYVDVNIHKEENKARVASLDQLPDSCAASADKLAEQRAAYEAKGIFSPAMIDSIIKTLRSYNDADIRREVKQHPELMSEMVSKYYYCG